jgi:allantoin racemase
VRVLLANPNSTEAITEACLALARAVAAPGTEVVGWTTREGPPVVDGFATDAAAGRALVAGLPGVRPLPDAVVLAGFGNYGTAAVKEALAVPVVSMAEAAMALATLLCHRFAIVTTAPRMIPYTEDLVRLTGFAARCAGVRAVSLPPLGEVAPDPDAVVAALGDQIVRVHAEWGADLVILGGSRLSPYAADLRRATRMPVLEPVASALVAAETLVRLGLRRSTTLAPPAPGRGRGGAGPGRD